MRPSCRACWTASDREDSELSVDRPRVAVNRVVREVELAADVALGQAAGEHAQDHELARAERSVAVAASRLAAVARGPRAAPRGCRDPGTSRASPSLRRSLRPRPRGGPGPGARPPARMSAFASSSGWPRCAQDRRPRSNSGSASSSSPRAASEAPSATKTSPSTSSRPRSRASSSGLVGKQRLLVDPAQLARDERAVGEAADGDTPLSARERELGRLREPAVGFVEPRR